MCRQNSRMCLSNRDDSWLEDMPLQSEPTDGAQLRRNVTNTPTYHFTGEILLGTQRTISIRLSYGTAHTDHWKIQSTQIVILEWPALWEISYWNGPPHGRYIRLAPVRGDWQRSLISEQFRELYLGTGKLVLTGYGITQNVKTETYQMSLHSKGPGENKFESYSKPQTLTYVLVALQVGLGFSLTLNSNPNP